MSTETKQAKICTICDDSFMGEDHVYQICKKCMRRHNIDLALADSLQTTTQELQKIYGETEMKMDIQYKAFLERYRKSSKRNRKWTILMFVYLLVWVIIMILDNFVWK